MRRNGGAERSCPQHAGSADAVADDVHRAASFVGQRGRPRHRHIRCSDHNCRRRHLSHGRAAPWRSRAAAWSAHPRHAASSRYCPCHPCTSSSPGPDSAVSRPMRTPSTLVTECLAPSTRRSLRPKLRCCRADNPGYHARRQALQRCRSTSSLNVMLSIDAVRSQPRISTV